MTAPIFISHSSLDKVSALRICVALENRGLVCWMAGRDIPPGGNFQRAIVQAIRAAKVMVVVFTENANGSREVERELALASQRQLDVIPARMENVEPSEAFAYEMATRQWVNLFENWEQEIERLIACIIQTVPPAPMPPPGAGATVETPPETSPQPTLSRDAGAAIAGLEDHLDLPQPLRVVALLIIFQSTVRFGFLAISLYNFTQRFPALTFLTSPAPLLTMALVGAGLYSGFLILRRSDKARSHGLIVAVISLSFQAYYFGNDVYSVLGPPTAFQPTQFNLWVWHPFSLLIWAAALIVLFRWHRPGSRAPDNP